MRQVAEEIRNDYTRIKRRSGQDPGTAGDEAEGHWREILQGYLPASLHVVTKGRILSEDGRSSRQVDVLVLRPDYPPKLLGKKQYLAAGVLAAFECKLTLRKRDLPQIAATARSVRSMAVPSEHSIRGDLLSPIVYGVLSHSSEWSKLADVAEPGYDWSKDPVHISSISGPFDYALLDMLRGDAHPHDSLDLLCVADMTCVERHTYVRPPRRFIAEEVLAERDPGLGTYPEDGEISNAFYWAMTDEELPTENPVFACLSKIIRSLAWEVPSLRSMTAYWEAVQTPDDGKRWLGGVSHEWPYEMMAADVRQTIELMGPGRRLCQSDSTCWCGWSLRYT